LVLSLLLRTLHTRRLLVEVSIVHHFFLTNFVLFNIGVAIMKENKGKGVASGIEGEEDVQVLDDVTPVVV